MAIQTGYFPNINSQADDFFRSHFIATIASVDLAGIPNQAVIYYGFAPDTPDIYFLTRTDSRKIYQLKQNPHISFLVTEISQMQTYEIFGGSQILSDRDQIDTWIKILVSRVKHSPDPRWLPVLQLPHSGLSVVKIKPDQWIWSEFTADSELNDSV